MQTVYLALFDPSRASQFNPDGEVEGHGYYRVKMLLYWEADELWHTGHEYLYNQVITSWGQISEAKMYLQRADEVPVAAGSFTPITLDADDEMFLAKGTVTVDTQGVITMTPFKFDANGVRHDRIPFYEYEVHRVVIE